MEPVPLTTISDGEVSPVASMVPVLDFRKVGGYARGHGEARPDGDGIACAAHIFVHGLGGRIRNEQVPLRVHGETRRRHEARGHSGGCAGVY